MSTASKGYFSILQSRKDALRGETRNVAVVLVDVQQETGMVKAAPISQISPRLGDQGLLDQIVQGLSKHVEQESGFTLQSLNDLNKSLTSSLILTDPKPAVLPNGDADKLMTALYKAFVRPDTGGSSALSRGRVLDKVVETLRKYGKKVQRGAYIKDYIFDVVMESASKFDVLQVLSFATPSKNWIPSEHQTGYFLHAIEKLNKGGAAIIQPPGQKSDQKAFESHDRVIRLLKKSKVDTFAAIDLVHCLGLA